MLMAVLWQIRTCIQAGALSPFQVKGRLCCFGAEVGFVFYSLFSFVSCFWMLPSTDRAFNSCRNVLAFSLQLLRNLVQTLY